MFVAIKTESCKQKKTEIASNNAIPQHKKHLKTQLASNLVTKREEKSENDKVIYK